jgi:hypothetical protein
LHFLPQAQEELLPQQFTERNCTASASSRVPETWYNALLVATGTILSV